MTRSSHDFLQSTRVSPMHDSPSPVHHRVSGQNYLLRHFGVDHDPNWHRVHEAVFHPHELHVILHNEPHLVNKAYYDLKPVHLAIKYNPRALHTILRADADQIHAVGVDHMNMESAHNDTLLHMAVREDQPHAVAILLNEGHDVNAVNLMDHTPLHLAVKNANIGTFYELMQHDDIDVNKQDMHGNTPLHHVAHGLRHIKPRYRHARLWMARRLMDAGAHTHTRNHHGHTPHDIAVRENDHEMSELVQQKKIM